MKKISIYITAIFVIIMGMTSCEEEEKSPFPSHSELESAPYVSWEITTSTSFDLFDLDNARFGGRMYTPVDNVASHKIFVSRVNVAAGTESDPVLLDEITEFPMDVFFNISDITNALGIDLEDLNGGDQFKFVGESTGLNGVVLKKSNLSATIFSGDGAIGDLNQAYQLNSTVVCGYDPTFFTGQYRLESGFSPVGGVSLFGDNQTVQVTALDATRRQITVTYIPDAGIGNGSINFVFNLVCDKVVVPAGQASGLGCSGSITFGPLADFSSNATIDTENDDFIQIDFIENSTLDCSAPAFPQTITLTKV